MERRYGSSPYTCMTSRVYARISIKTKCQIWWVEDIFWCMDSCDQNPVRGDSDWELTRRVFSSEVFQWTHFPFMRNSSQGNPSHRSMYWGGRFRRSRKVHIPPVTRRSRSHLACRRWWCRRYLSRTCVTRKNTSSGDSLFLSGKMIWTLSFAWDIRRIKKSPRQIEVIFLIHWFIQIILVESILSMDYIRWWQDMPQDHVMWK